MSDFFKQEALGLPYWAWFAIALAVACLLIVAILITCLTKKGTKNADDSAESADGEKSESKQEVKETAVAEEKPAEEKPAEKPAAKKTAEKKEETAKSTAAKTTEKKESTAKSTTAKTAATKTTTAKTTAKEEAGSSEAKVYHISKRKEDGKWQVKAEGADRALRLFFTQADAIAYAKKVAGNQEGRIVVHKESGGFRKLNY